MKMERQKMVRCHGMLTGMTRAYISLGSGSDILNVDDRPNNRGGRFFQKIFYLREGSLDKCFMGKRVAQSQNHLEQEDTSTKKKDSSALRIKKVDTFTNQRTAFGIRLLPKERV